MTVVPREIEDNGYAKPFILFFFFGGGGGGPQGKVYKVHYCLYETGDLD